MSSGLMNFFCRQCFNSEEKEQQQYSNRYYEELKHNDNNIVSKTLSKKDKNVFSFKYETFSKGYKSQNNILSHSKSLEAIHQARQNRYDHSQSRNYVPIVHYSKSPSIKFNYSPEHYKQIENTSFMPAKPTISAKYTQCHAYKGVPLISKMYGKRVRTIQQETQYSSKESQVNSKFSPQSTEISNFYQSRSNNFKKQSNPIIFQELVQQSLNTTKINGNITDQNKKHLDSEQQIPSNIQPMFDFYNNPHTLQTIMTATQIKSRNQIQITNQIPYLRFLKETPYKLSSLQLHNNDRYMQSINTSPRQNYTSPSKRVQIYDYSNIDSNLLYSSKFQNSQYQKISVLNIDQAEKSRNSPFKMTKKINEFKISALNSIQQSQTSQNLQEEQLRDVIDNTFVQSSRNGNIKAFSPFISHQSSVKNINNEEKKSKYVSFKAISPVHSRNSSNQFGLFAKTRANLGRTNTIQSMESHYSENSCIDIKFMQRVRSRKGVSKLISDKE